MGKVVNEETGEIVERVTTSISASAARLALACVLDSGEGHPLDRVLVETEYVAASDGRRLLVVGEPDAENGLFVRRRTVATVSTDALKDAVRGAARVHVSPTSLASLDEDGATVRVVPFTEADAALFPDWRTHLPPRQPVVARFNPALVGDVMRLLAQLEVTEVKLSMGSARDPLVFECDLASGAPVTLVVLPITSQMAMPEGRPGGIDSMTLSSGGHSVTITKEDAARIGSSVDAIAKRAEAAHRKGRQRKPKGDDGES